MSYQCQIKRKLEETKGENHETDHNVKLITTKTCPKCIQAEKILNDAGVSFIKIMAEDNSELVSELDIRQAPTLVVGDKKFSGISGIYDYVKKIGGTL